MTERHTEHRFDEEMTCRWCGAHMDDAIQEPIGCEAGPEGNPPSYIGFALTPDEQERGVTPLEKFHIWTARRDR